MTKRAHRAQASTPASSSKSRQHKSSHKKLRRRLDQIEHELAQFHLVSDEKIKLVVKHRPELLPVVTLATCNVDYLVELLGYKPVMRALTRLLRLMLRRLTIARAATAKVIKSRTPPLPDRGPLVLEEDPTTIPVATDAVPRNRV